MTSTSVIYIAPKLLLVRWHTNVTDVIVQAAVYGSGCWARSPTEESDVGVACCTTGMKPDTSQQINQGMWNKRVIFFHFAGCGEYLIKTMLAKECAEMALNRLVCWVRYL